METSAKGKAFLAHHEGGHVLRAYKCPSNIWTIGVGLTAASGVVKPYAGMVITQQESERLFSLALPKYERPMRTAMGPFVKQHEFDGGVSFHWNSGQGHKASWVKLLVAGDYAGAEASLKSWNKGGGKVLRGLVNRRKAEADLIFRGTYGAGAHNAGTVRVPRHDATSRQPAMKRGDRGDGVTQLQEQLRTLGYYEGVATGDFAEYTEMAVRRFQRAHPHLTEDGIAGAATMAQIQRNIDARKKATNTTVGGATGGAATGGGNEALGGADVTSIPTEWLIAGVGALVALALFIIAWQYRDVITQRVRRNK